MVTHGTASFVIEADDALHDVVLTKATGDLDGSNATFTWIDNVPPVGADRRSSAPRRSRHLDIQISSAHQRYRGAVAPTC